MAALLLDEPAALAKQPLQMRRSGSGRAHLEPLEARRVLVIKPQYRVCYSVIFLQFHTHPECPPEGSDLQAEWANIERQNCRGTRSRRWLIMESGHFPQCESWTGEGIAFAASAASKAHKHGPCRRHPQTLPARRPALATKATCEATAKTKPPWGFSPHSSGGDLKTR